MLLLSLVVEAPYVSQPFWCPLPKEPWPQFVELSASSTDDDVALVLLQLATCNNRGSKRPLSAAELLSADELVLPGGLRASAGTKSIYPSCCAGLENWTEWQATAENGVSPWMGHDPWPWTEMVEDQLYLWPDKSLPHEQRDALAIRFTHAELAKQLQNVSEDLASFSALLRNVLRSCAPKEADELASNFERTFSKNLADDA